MSFCIIILRIECNGSGVIFITINSQFIDISFVNKSQLIAAKLCFYLQNRYFTHY